MALCNNHLLLLSQEGKAWNINIWIKNNNFKCILTLVCRKLIAFILLFL